MYGDHELSAFLPHNCAQHLGKLDDVHVVHVLHRVEVLGVSRTV